MGAISFERENGRIVAAYMGLPGRQDLRIAVSGIGSDEEARLLSNAFNNVSSEQIGVWTRATAVHNPAAEARVEQGLQDLVDASDATATVGDVRRVSRPDVPSSSLPSWTQPSIDRVSNRIDDEVITGPNQIGYDNRDRGTSIRADLSGLSALEANTLAMYLENELVERQLFVDLMGGVSQDKRLTPAERQLVNNDLEQLFIRAGVSADVSAVRVSSLNDASAPAGPESSSVAQRSTAAPARS